MSQQVTIGQKKKTVRDLLEERKLELKDILPKAMDIRRFTEGVMTACGRVPDLYSCDIGSLYGAVKTAAELGLSLNPTLGEACIIPRKIKGNPVAFFQPQYKGIIKLAVNSGVVSRVYGGIRRKNDLWEYQQGSGQILKWAPSDEGPSKKLGAFIDIELTNGGPALIDYMPRWELEAHKARYCRASNSPWDKFNDELPSESDGMWIKTVLIRAMNRFLVKDSEKTALSRAIEKDYESEREEVIDISAMDISEDFDPNHAALDTIADELEGTEAPLKGWDDQG